LGDLSAALSTAKGAVVKGTSEKQLRAWKRFQLYLQSIGIVNNPYLDGFDRGQRHKYFAPLDSSSGKVDLILSLPSFSSLSLSAPPWIAWHRPSSWLPEQTQGSTPTGTLHSFYNDNSEVTDLPIPEKDLK
jgi:hypothetical protein